MSDYELWVRGVRLPTPALRHHSYFGFQDEDLDLLDQLTVEGQTGEPGFITEPYGIRTRVASLWPDMAQYSGHVAGLPIPSNWHWEASEWIAVMRSVLQAKDRYRIMELGAGWGPAVVAGSVLARRRGITDIKATALEADAAHYATLRQHFLDNGFDPDEHAVMDAAVGRHSGTAKWPITDNNAAEYGNRPLDTVQDSQGGEDRTQDYLGRDIAQTRDVTVVSFRSLLMSEPVWDLLHVDIQGGEVEICSDTIDLMNERAGRVCFGVHSRKLDGDLFDIFWKAGWVLEGDTPTRFNFNRAAQSAEAMTSVDGCQVWRNPRLREELKA